MNTEETAKCLAELGHVTRLQIYRFLVRMGKSVSVGDIQQELSIPSSTLSHHISRLTKAELISQERDGRVLYCSPQFTRLQGIIDFLVDECCEGEGCEEISSCSESLCSN